MNVQPSSIAQAQLVALFSAVHVLLVVVIVYLPLHVLDE